MKNFFKKINRKVKTWLSDISICIWEVDLVDLNDTDATGQSIIYARYYFFFKKQSEKYAQWAKKQYANEFNVSWGGEPLFLFHFEEAFEDD